MNVRSIILLLMTATAIVLPALAQENVTATQAATGERDCIPAAEAEQSAGDESGPTGEGDAEPGATLPICEEIDADAADDESAPSPAPDSSGDEPDDGPGDDVDDEDFGREFEPTDEISEDYPIPLPSDI